MFNLLRIAIAELLLVCFLFSTILSPSVYAEGLDEQVNPEAHIELSLESSVSESLTPDTVNTGSVSLGDSSLDITGSGTKESSVISDPSNPDSSTVSTDSTDNDSDTHSGDIMIVDTTVLGNNSDPIIIQDTTESDEIEITQNTESESKEESTPVEEILVQFHTDIDGYLGGYQVEQVAMLNSLTTEELIVENNIAVMSIEEDTLMPLVSNNNSGSLMPQFSDNTTEDRIDELINVIKQDPRVAHVQKNFIYTTASSYNPLSIWQNTSTGVTTSTGKVEYFQIIAPSTVMVNQSFDVTIRPKDINGLTVTNYTGSFIFISEYFGDIVPSPGQAIVFSGSNGEMSFPLGMQLRNTGQNSIFVSSVDSQDITGEASVHVQAELPINVNDPDFSKLWGLHNDGQSVDGTIGTIDADIDYPEAIAYASGRLGTGVIVAVLDTGIAYNHPDLSGHMWDGSQCLSDTGIILGGCMYGYDFGDDDKNPMDSKDGALGHGTHVAGTIGALVNNGTGITGVAPNVQLMSVKIFGTKSQATTSSVIRGINFARHNGAKVINASFGGGNYIPKRIGEFDLLTYQAIQSFSGIFVAAAGNDSNNTDTGHFYPAGFGSDLIVSGEVNISGRIVTSGEVHYPALQNVIAVAASDQDDNLAVFSNYGTKTVHVAAPGVSIYSSYLQVGSQLEYISDSWVKSGNSHSGILLINGEGHLIVDDMRTMISGEAAYVSGETAYIEKEFATASGKKSVYIGSVPIWCDTPYSYDEWKDYISIGYDIGNGYVEDKRFDETSIWNSSWASEQTIDGRVGTMGYITSDTFEALNPTFKIRIGWHTDNIDDIDPTTGKYYGGCRIMGGFFVEQVDDGSVGDYRYWQGTSMASPHVAGAAALAMSYAPTASMDDVRNAILWTSDYKSQLSDKVMYGRLNVANMLKGLEKPVITSTKVTLSGESGAKIQVETSIDNDRIWKNIVISKNKNFYGTSGILPQIETLYANGIIASRSEESLDYSMTRAEAARLIATVGGYTPTTCTGIFADVESDLGDLCGYIEALAQSNIISTGSTFRPNSLVTNGEFYKMLILGIGEDSHELGGGGSEFGGYAQRIMELGCGVSSDFSTSLSRWNSFFTIVCVTKMDDITDTRNISIPYGQDIAHIVGLSPDTTYHYYPEVYGAISYTGSRFAYQSFHTPRVILQRATGITTGTGAYYLSGSTASGVTYGTGGAQKLILSDTGSTATLELSLTGLTITASGGWDGLFSAPNMIATNTGIRLNSGSILIVDSIYEIGSTEASLVLSGKLATIRIKTSRGTGTTLRVYRSDNNGNIFADVGSCMVSGGECIFTTNHFSQFALGNPISPSVSPGNPSTPSTNQSSNGGNSGGGGIGPTTMYSTMDFFPNSLLLESIYGLGKLRTSTSKNAPKELHEMVIFLSVELLSITSDTTKNIEKSLLDSINTRGNTKLNKLLMFDRSLTSINRMLKEYPSIRSKEYKILISLKREIKKERTIFIKEDILGL